MKELILIQQITMIKKIAISKSYETVYKTIYVKLNLELF